MTEPEPAAVPGVVLATVIVLAVAGVLRIAAGVVRGPLSPAAWLGVVLGALWVFLAYQLYRRRRWAWIATVVLCAVGLVVAALRIVGDPSTGIVALDGPITYPILLFMPAARAWFARSARP